jgi:hypothetical protein
VGRLGIEPARGVRRLLLGLLSAATPVGTSRN